MLGVPLYQWFAGQLEASYAWQKAYTIAGTLVIGVALTLGGFTFAMPEKFDFWNDRTATHGTASPDDNKKDSSPASHKPSPTTTGGGKQPGTTGGAATGSPAAPAPSGPATSAPASAPPASAQPSGDPSTAGEPTDPPDGNGDPDDDDGDVVIDVPGLPPVTIGATSP